MKRWKVWYVDGSSNETTALVPFSEHRFRWMAEFYVWFETRTWLPGGDIMDKKGAEFIIQDLVK